MEREALLLENAKIFTAQGAALNKVASRNVKVLVGLRNYYLSRLAGDACLPFL